MNKCLFLVFLMFGTVVVATTPSRKADNPTPVSMVELLARSSSFHGKLVSVTGVLSVQPDVIRLFLSKDHERVYDESSSVLLVLRGSRMMPDPKFDGTFIRLEGRFHRESDARFGFIDEIWNVMSVEPREK
jgi:hypothetical protein